MKWVRRLLFVGLLVTVWWAGWQFARQNAEAVTVNYLAGSFEDVPLWMLVSCAFGFGVVLTSVVALVRGLLLRMERRRYRKAARDLESEVHQLRSLPLSAEPALDEMPASLGGAGKDA